MLPDGRISTKRLFTWRHYPSAQPAGDDWLRIQISMSCANFWYSPPLKFVPWDVKQTNKVTVFDISQGTSFLCGRILQNSARLYEIVSESISIDPGRNLEIVASVFEKARLIIVVSAWERLELKLSMGAARRKYKPNPDQRRIWFTFDQDCSPRQLPAAGNVNQTPAKEGFGLHSVIISSNGGLRPPEM